MTNEVLAAVMQNVVGAGLDRKLDLLMQSALDDHVAQLVDTAGLEAEIVVVEDDGFLSVLIDQDVELLDDFLRRPVAIPPARQQALAAKRAAIRASASTCHEPHVLF